MPEMLVSRLKTKGLNPDDPRVIGNLPRRSSIVSGDCHAPFCTHLFANSSSSQCLFHDQPGNLFPSQLRFDFPCNRNIMYSYTIQGLNDSVMPITFAADRSPLQDHLHTVAL